MGWQESGLQGSTLAASMGTSFRLNNALILTGRGRRGRAAGYLLTGSLSDYVSATAGPASLSSHLAGSSDHHGCCTPAYAGRGRSVPGSRVVIFQKKQ